tara:strand:+ start:477 stop:1877 length:1401 start_codon:yes stop_codon:yes gene_type:complete
MPVFSNEYKINAGADISYPAVEGVANQRVWNVSVPNNEMQRLGAWYFPEGAIGLYIQISATTAGNSATSQYIFQSGFSGGGTAGEQAGDWFRLMPFNSGVGHGANEDTGGNNHYAPYIGGSNIQGNYTKELGIYNNRGGTSNFTVSVIELTRGMTFTDNSALDNLTSFTISGYLHSIRRMGIGKELFIGNNTRSGTGSAAEGTAAQGTANGIMSYIESPVNGRSGIVVGVNNECFIGNRLGSDGTVVRIRQDGNTEGEIKVNGGTVTYGPFMGAHKAQLIDHSKPDLLVGTVLETVDQLATWKYASFNVGEVTKYIPYYGSKNDGETDTITFESNTYNATIKNYRDSMPEMTKHVCVKVSDTVGSKAVFGVFNCWQEEDVIERESGNAEYTWNDMDVASIGNYYIRMQSGQTPEVGDYVESAGDGTAKVQSDDILRSKTIAKITSTIKQKTYDDGSFLVTCTLHCG